jgi:threonine dehydratase
LAVAEAMRIRKRRATIYVAEDIDPSRLALLRAHGLDLVIYGEVAWDAEKEARRVAEDKDMIYVSPYNDPIVVGVEKSIRLLFEQHRLVVEGSGALSVGGLLKRKEHFKGKKVVAVICGRNIPLELFKRIIA